MSCKKPVKENLWPLGSVKSWATNTHKAKMAKIQASTEVAWTAWKYSTTVGQHTHSQWRMNNTHNKGCILPHCCDQVSYMCYRSSTNSICMLLNYDPCLQLKIWILPSDQVIMWTYVDKGNSHSIYHPHSLVGWCSARKSQKISTWTTGQLILFQWPTKPDDSDEESVYVKINATRRQLFTSYKVMQTEPCLKCGHLTIYLMTQLCSCVCV